MLGKGIYLNFYTLHVLQSEKFVMVVLEAVVTHVFVGDIKAAVACLKLFQ